LVWANLGSRILIRFHCESHCSYCTPVLSRRHLFSPSASGVKRTGAAVNAVRKLYSAEFCFALLRAKIPISK
jgi:hypothetical protein